MQEFIIYHMKRVEFTNRGQIVCAMNPLISGIVAANTPEEALTKAKKMRPYLVPHIAVGVKAAHAV